MFRFFSCFFASVGLLKNVTENPRFASDRTDVVECKCKYYSVHRFLMQVQQVNAWMKVQNFQNPEPKKIRI